MASIITNVKSDMRKRKVGPWCFSTMLSNIVARCAVV